MCSAVYYLLYSNQQLLSKISDRQHNEDMLRPLWRHGNRKCSVIKNTSNYCRRQYASDLRALGTQIKNDSNLFVYQENNTRKFFHSLVKNYTKLIDGSNKNNL